MMGERIKLLRNKLGLTQQDLADKIGYSDKASIALIENGKRVLPTEKIPLTAKALCTSADYLYGITDNPERIIKGDSFDTPEDFWKARNDLIQRIADFDRKLLDSYHTASDKNRLLVRTILEIDENGDKVKE